MSKQTNAETQLADKQGHHGLEQSAERRCQHATLRAKSERMWPRMARNRPADTLVYAWTSPMQRENGRLTKLTHNNQHIRTQTPRCSQRVSGIDQHELPIKEECETPWRKARCPRQSRHPTQQLKTSNHKTSMAWIGRPEEAIAHQTWPMVIPCKHRMHPFRRDRSRTRYQWRWVLQINADPPERPPR